MTTKQTANEQISYLGDIYEATKGILSDFNITPNSKTGMLHVNIRHMRNIAATAIQESAPEIELGSRVKDRVTGFTGVAVSRIVYLNGCVQYGVRPRVSSDNKIIDCEYIDVAQLEALDNDPVKVEPANTGGPQRDCPRH